MKLCLHHPLFPEGLTKAVGVEQVPQDIRREPYMVNEAYKVLIKHLGRSCSICLMKVSDTRIEALLYTHEFAPILMDGLLIITLEET